MKDAYYFPHFCNARHDRKIMRLRKELGVEGYGIFFMLLEILREQIDFKYPMKDMDLLADEFGCSEQKLRVVICNYQLFQVDPDEQFFSPKLILYLQPYFERSEKARQMALKRWGKTEELIEGCTSNAQAMPQHSTSNANKVKEKKEKEIKIKYAEFVNMTEEEYNKLISEFGQALINDKIEDLSLWKGSKGKQTKSDYLTIRQWIKKDNKSNPQHKNPSRNNMDLTDL